MTFSTVAVLTCMLPVGAHLVSYIQHVSVLSSAVKRSRAVSDDEKSDSDAGSDGPDKSLAAKLKELGSDSASEEDDRPKTAAGKKDEKELFGSDSDSGDDDEEE